MTSNTSLTGRLIKLEELQKEGYKHRGKLSSHHILYTNDRQGYILEKVDDTTYRVYTAYKKDPSQSEKYKLRCSTI